MSNVSISDIVGRYPFTDEQKTHLTGALVEREEALADTLRLAGVQFGLYPQIVSEVLAEVQMGEPISEDQRLLIRAQFQALMEELSRQQSGGQ